MINQDVYVQDDFLSSDHFELLNQIILQYDFFWSWNSILYQGDFISDEKYNRQLVHWFYPKKGPFKDYYEVFKLIPDQLGAKEVIRMKLNCNYPTDEIMDHGFHIDTEENSNTSIFYLNTNNGYTKFEDNGEIVKSVENRMITFDSSRRHSGSSCTDEYNRLVLNINWK
tara:strand:+ start:1199 stop:1705 length:507 start_codon:yes stop_codon:yes gene_type:complete